MEDGMLVYSLYDRKLGEYGALVLSRNDEGIQRSILDGIPGSGSTIERHPEDFDLMCLGVFNQVSGDVVSIGRPRYVARVDQILSRPEVKENG